MLSGAYEDDKDYGDIICYSREGENDYKREKRQVGDQKTSLGNEAMMNSYRLQTEVCVNCGHDVDSSHVWNKCYIFDGFCKVYHKKCEERASNLSMAELELPKEAQARTSVRGNLLAVLKELPPNDTNCFQSNIHDYERFPISQCNDCLDRMDLNITTSLKLEFSNGHNFFKFCLNWPYEVFFDIYKIHRFPKHLICPIWKKNSYIMTI